MKAVCVVALLVGAAAAFSPEWENFKTTYGKTFSSVGEEQAREAIFNLNLKLIDEHNAKYQKGEESFYLGVNQLADLTAAESAAMLNGLKKNGKSRYQDCPAKFEEQDFEVTNATVDWRTKGYVTPVKNQGQCGSCWAFSATGSLEGQHFARTGKLVSLSEQNLVDCSGSEGNQGCNGGLPDNAFIYIHKNKGLDTEASYPYTAEDGNCKYATNSVGAHDVGCTDVTSDSEKALTQASQKLGPISVAIDASSYKFQLYSGGVYYNSECSSTGLDHGVLVVGFGSLNSKDYYIVKNSWGTSWGMKGYIYMSRNRNNNCGIATAASFPTVPKNGLF